MTPAEREARWTLYMRFAIEAVSEDETRAVLGQVLAYLKPELPLRGEPVIHPRHRRNPDDIWVAEAEPDLTHVQVIDPDDAKTRCRFVEGHFPGGVSWSLPLNTEREAKYEWPPDIWQRQPGQDDMLLHPAVRAVMISCAAKMSLPDTPIDAVNVKYIWLVKNTRDYKLNIAAVILIQEEERPDASKRNDRRTRRRRQPLHFPGDASIRCLSSTTNHSSRPSNWFSRYSRRPSTESCRRHKDRRRLRGIQRYARILYANWRGR